MTDFEGRNIVGDVQHYSRHRISEQHEPIKFIEAIEKLLNTQHVDAVQWEQYTPYFNDGDPCYFELHEIKVRIVDENENVVENEEYGYEFFDASGLHPYGEGKTWEERYANRKYQIGSINTKPIDDALSEFADEIGHHELILQDKFGDPAQVTAYLKDGEVEFNVDFYVHD